MQDIGKAEFQARLGAARAAAEKMARDLPTLPNKSFAYGGIAGYWSRAGRCALQLGLKEEARSCFGRAATSLAEGAALPTREPQGPNRLNALEYAILSGDAPLALRCAEAGTSGKIGLGPPSAGYYDALCALVLNQMDALRSAAEELARLPDDKAVKMRFLPGLSAVVKAVTANDEAALAKGLVTVLECHVNYATKGQLRGLDAAVVCVPATCLALGALRRGVKVSVPDSFHKVSVSHTVSDLQDSKGQKFDWTADVLPVGMLG